jgi:predicted DCC family thiol-disulfide oxidoreductase YuxK
MTSKILVYDGDCPMCDAGSALALRVLRLPEERRRPFQSFEGEMAGRLLAAGMQNEMAVIDPASGEIRTGIPGILGLLHETRARWVARLLDRPWLHPALSAAYHLVAYNRRTIAPPRRKPAFACACDPEYRPGWLLALIAILLGFTLGMTALFGAVVATPTQMLIAAGSGWVLILLASLAFPRETRLPFLGHLGMVMAGGLLVLVPSMLLVPLLEGKWMAGVFLFSVAASILLMLRSLRRRLAYLRS